MRSRSFSSKSRNSFSAFLTVTILAMLAALLIAPLAQAQITGTFTGTVADQTGAVVPNAKVTLVNEATSVTRETVANGAGYFAFPAVDPGNYTVKIEVANFKTWQKTGLVMNVGDSREIPGIRLDVGSATETVTVEAVGAEVAAVDSGERSSLLTAKNIDQLALQSRNVSELLKILPGVVTAPNGLNNTPGFDFGTAGANGSAVGVGLNANGVPNRGASSITSDGANIIDAGCNCWATAVINPEMTQEVKVQTSNFGADGNHGPVVVNAISKSGTDTYHGAAYFNARNGVLNANTWQNNQHQVARPSEAYYFPGGNFGGPVPFTHKKLFFWQGFEYFWQKTGSDNPLQSYIPTSDMLSGNFGPTAANLKLCPDGFNDSANNWCRSVNGSIAPDGTVISGDQIPLQFLDPGAAALLSILPAANTDPASNSSGFNYFLPVTSQHNPYMLRSRVDYNFNENNKFYVSFQYAKDNAPWNGNAHIWWVPNNAIEFPGGGGVSPSVSKTATGHFVHVFSPSLTNEFTATWSYGDNPQAPNDFKRVLRSTIGWPGGDRNTGPGSNYGSVYNTGVQMMPSWNTYYNGAGFPDFSQFDGFENPTGAFDTRKATPLFSDDLSKVWRAHTLKFGAFTENVGNLQQANTFPNGIFSFNPGQHASALDPEGPNIGSNNPVAQFVMGIASGYQQDSLAPITDMAYRTISFYGMDSWKASKRLTVEVGFRFDHFGRWYDRQGVGMAVWLPGRLQSDVASGKSFPGVWWHGIDPGIPNGGSPVRTLFTSPRFGVAYDLFGTGKTVLRGGWGAYRWNDQYNDYAGPLQLSLGRQQYNLPGNLNVPISQLGALTPTTAWSPSSAFTANPNDYEIPITHSYNFTISQELPWKSLLEVAYVGNSSGSLLMGGQNGAATGGEWTNVNRIALGALFKPDPVTGVTSLNPENVGTNPGGVSTGNQLKDYFAYGSAYNDQPIYMTKHAGYSNYNALQVSWLKRAGRIAFDLNYTWSKNLDLNHNIDAYSVHGNYGISNIDRPHVINTSYTFDVGKPYHGDMKVFGGAANGWTISGITTFQAGGNIQAGYNPNLGLQLNYVCPAADSGDGAGCVRNSDDSAWVLPPGVDSGFGVPTYFGTHASAANQGFMAVMPLTTCSPTSGLHDGQKINPSCFSVQSPGVIGPRQYPYLSGPAYFNWDLAIFKTFHITERQNVQFRFSAFNFLNHPLPQFSGSSQVQLKYTKVYQGDAAFNSTPFVLDPNLPANWGATDSKAGRRQIELGLKYSF